MSRADWFLARGQLQERKKFKVKLLDKTRCGRDSPFRVALFNKQDPLLVHYSNVVDYSNVCPRVCHLKEMFTKFRTGESSACHCGTSPMTVEHFLQDCQNHQTLRIETWPADTLVREKIYGRVENLQRTAAYVRATGVPV